MDGWLRFNGILKHASSGYSMPEESLVRPVACIKQIICLGWTV